MESAKDGKTTALLAAPPPATLGVSYVMDDSLSYEVADAPAVCVPTTLPVISLAEMRVIALLREHLSLFLDAESNFQVDRRAMHSEGTMKPLTKETGWTVRRDKFKLWIRRLHIVPQHRALRSHR